MKTKHMSSSRIILLGFIVMIAIGTLLLMLPVSRSGDGHASLSDALFTAASAVCVTGLTVQDTASYWTTFGHAVILVLVQIGGMGAVTMAIAVAMFSGRKIGLMQRSTLQEAIAAPKVSGIVRLTNFIIKGTLITELIGAAAMYPVFSSVYGPLRGIWQAVFHSVSSFCNAGFDIIGVDAPEIIASDISVSVTAMLLVVFGGIGFLTWEDIRVHGIKLRKYRMQSKVILFFSALLILIPALFFYFYEFARPEWAWLDSGERLRYALFQSVMTRTGGFKIADMSLFSESGIIIIMILMLIGGSPGSTAGGIKTTTVAVLIMTAFAVFRKHDDPQLFGRRIDSEAVHQAAALLFMYMMLFIIAGLAICCTEPVTAQQAFFEVAAAAGTTGMSFGITASLGWISRLILITLMIFGRVGGMTLIFAAWSTPKHSVYRLPMEKITVG